MYTLKKLNYPTQKYHYNPTILALLYYFRSKKKKRKKKFICPALPIVYTLESFYTMKTIPNGDLEIAKLIMRYSGLSSRRYQYS